MTLVGCARYPRLLVLLTASLARWSAARRVRRGRPTARGEFRFVAARRPARPSPAADRRSAPDVTGHAGRRRDAGTCRRSTARSSCSTSGAPGARRAGSRPPDFSVAADARRPRRRVHGRRRARRPSRTRRASLTPRTHDGRSPYPAVFDRPGEVPRTASADSAGQRASRPRSCSTEQGRVAAVYVAAADSAGHRARVLTSAGGGGVSVGRRRSRSMVTDGPLAGRRPRCSRRCAGAGWSASPRRACCRWCRATSPTSPAWSARRRTRDRPGRRRAATATGARVARPDGARRAAVRARLHGRLRRVSASAFGGSADALLRAPGGAPAHRAASS